jgi:anthranilate synthase component II
MKVLVIDNYDSFVYNLVHMLVAFDCTVEVRRNDKITLEEVNNYESVLLSPGPGVPSDAGIMPALLKAYSPHKKILGVCLGHQAIAEAFGGKLRNLSIPFHGVAEKNIITDKNEVLFKGLPAEFEVGRYHSWVVDSVIPECLVVTSKDENGEIMSLRHKEYNVCGVQFHPESVLTQYGKEIILNWIKS